MVFLSRQVLDTRPDFDHIEHGQLDDFKFSGAAPGAGTPWKPTTVLRRQITLPFLFGNKTEWRAFRDFFAALGGCRSGFWLPLWITDYEASVHAQGTTAVRIKNVNLSSLFVADRQFAFMALIDRLLIEPAEIANVTVLGGGDEQLNLAATIAGDFDPRETVCCAMIYARLADDPIRYQFLTDGVVRADLQFVELPQEYVTPRTGTLPIYLYEFTRGLKTWRMTNWPEPLVIDGECWSPDNIRHGSLKSGIDFLAEDMTLEAATDAPDHPLRYYTTRSAFEVTELEIFETDGDTLAFDRANPLYRGRLGGVEFRNEGVINVNCSSLLRLSEQQLPRMQIQRTCNHRLYDPNCRASAGLFAAPAVLATVTEDYVEAAAFATEAAARGDDQWFALGKVTVGPEVRMVVGQDAGRLYLDEPFYLAAVGDAAVAYPGCNKRVSHCVGRFNNIRNAVMFTYMPNSNPQIDMLLNPKPPGGKKG